MNKVEKIKDWISKTQDGLMDTHGNFGYPEHEGAYHILCNLDAYIDSLQEEPISNNLEKAATKYARKQLSNPDYPTYNDEYEMECAFEADAQWQKQQDQSTIELAEDHAYLAGQEKIIAKAIKWLEDNIDRYLYNTGGYEEYIPKCGGKMFEDFKKAMEE